MLVGKSIVSVTDSWGETITVERIERAFIVTTSSAAGVTIPAIDWPYFAVAVNELALASMLGEAIAAPTAEGG